MSKEQELRNALSKLLSAIGDALGYCDACDPEEDPDDLCYICEATEQAEKALDD